MMMDDDVDFIDVPSVSMVVPSASGDAVFPLHTHHRDLCVMPLRTRVFGVVESVVELPKASA